MLIVKRNDELETNVWRGLQKQIQDMSLHNELSAAFHITFTALRCGDFKAQMLNTPPKPNSSTNVQQ